MARNSKSLQASLPDPKDTEKPPPNTAPSPEPTNLPAGVDTSQRPPKPSRKSRKAANNKGKGSENSNPQGETSEMKKTSKKDRRTQQAQQDVLAAEQEAEDDNGDQERKTRDKFAKMAEENARLKRQLSDMQGVFSLTSASRTHRPCLQLADKKPDEVNAVRART